MDKRRKYEDIIMENDKLRKKIQKLENDLSDKVNLDSLLKNSPTNIFLFDENEKFIYANPSACRLLGYKEKELLSLSFSDILSKKKREKGTSIIHKLIESGKKSRNELELVRKDQNRVYVSLDLRTLSEDRYVAYCNDITKFKQAEIALKKSVENNRKFIDDSIVGVFKTNIKGEVLFVNDATVNMFKFKSKEELIGSSALMHYLDPSKREGLMELLKKKKSVDNLNLEFLANTGETIVVSLNAVLDGDEILGMFTDITDKVKAEKLLIELNEKLCDINDRIHLINEELKESHNRYLSLFDNTGTATCLLDGPGKILLCNSKFEELSGYLKEEIEGKLMWSDLTAEEDIERCKNIRDKRIKGTGDAPEEYEFKFKDKFNNKKDVHVNVGFLPGSNEWIASLIDITIRKQTEKALIQSEERLRSLYESATIGIYRTTPEGHIVMANQAAVRMLGYNSFNELAKRNLEKNGFEPRYSRKDFRKRIEREGIVIGLESAWKRKDGSVIYVREGAKAIRDINGKIVYYDGTFEDITERKNYESQLKLAKEKAEESDKLKSAFLANMSHEIRTPMNAILGFANLLKSKKIDKKRKETFIDIINAKSRQLLQIISDIIDISKIEADQITIINKNFSLNELIDQLTLYFKTLKKHDNKPIEINLHYGLPMEKSYIHSDNVRIEQILTNLLSNAYKFTEKGSIDIGYEIEDFKNIIFYVKDTGIGLTELEQSVIFDRFRQVSASFNRLYSGTGLGLSISKGLVDKLKGTIWVESEINKGSTFYFKIPYVPGIATKKSDKHAKKSKLNWKGKTILIAEDEDTNFTFINTLLRPTSAAVIRAKDGIEVINICKNNSKINLVLMDIKLPGINGLEATKQIRKFRKSLPIIAHTAYAMSVDEDECLKAGCDAYICKPVKIDPLLRLIQQYIN
jgi:PAS domain S-box-containing protein